MPTHVISDWLTIVGGSAMSRDAIVFGFSGDAESSVQRIATQLQARITVVFCNSEANHEALAAAAAEPDEYVLGVIPDLDLNSFHRVLRHGASGVVWEDTPVAHLADVARAALHHDILLPAQLVRMIANGDLDRPATMADLDPATAEILLALASGLSMREIATTMNYSERTIQRRITNICLTLGALTPAQAVHLAHKKGLLK